MSDEWESTRPARRVASLVTAAVVVALVTPGVPAASAPAPQALAGWEFVDEATRRIGRGQYDEALELAQSRPARDPDAAAILARLDLSRGRYEEAESRLVAAVEFDREGEAAVELGALYLTLGRRAEGVGLLRPIVAAAATSRLLPDIYRGARAAHALGLFRDANKYFRLAASIVPRDAGVNTAWGDLFLEKYNTKEAVASYQAALQADGEWSQAHLGLARAISDSNSAAARAAAERALEIDEYLVGAHVVLAQLALNDSQRDEARAALARAADVDPRSLPVLSLLAATAYLEDETAEFEQHAAAALAINPVYGEVFRVAGEQAARNYRFAEAAALVRRGLEIDPDDTRAHADLGVHLLRTGDEAEARVSLERAFRDDPYDVVTYNLLGLFDSLEKFVTVREGDLVVRMHADEVSVLQEYALPLAQEALAALSERYAFTPTGPILIEIFPKHDDFAVRNVGLPGMIGALGACFGRVVTMDSPKARPPGSFSWGATLWHELAHVITLQMSNQRVPRWLTEGLSVFEEKRARPEWGREMEITFAQAINEGVVLPLEELNAGFTKPETISLAYFEASLLVAHLIDRFGEPAIHELLGAYGEGLETDAALQRVLGETLADLQSGFDASLEAQFGELRRALRRVMQDGQEYRLPDMQILAAENPGSYPLQLALGRTRLQGGDLTGAIEAFTAAVRLVPMAAGEGSARALLIDAYLQRGDRQQAMAELEALLAYDHTDVEAARQLAGLAEAEGDDDRRWLAYERIIAIDPFDASRHGALGRMALDRSEPEIAAREFRAALASQPVDPAAAHCDLAESYVRLGRFDDARRQALSALEIAPTYERAQELLLDIIDRAP